MMKLNKYSWLAILPMIFTACQDDTLVENQQRDNKVYTLTANMEDGATMSRAQIQLGKTTSGEELFFWNENDQFNLYLNGNTEPNVFTIANDYTEPYEGEQKKATFTTTTPVPIDEEYVAVYPSEVLMEDNSFNFYINNTLNFNSGTDKKEIWASYLQQNMFMMANGKFEDPDNASVSFNHLCALIRVSYSNQSGVAQSINELSIYSKNQQFSSAYRYVMGDTTSAEPEWSSYSLYTEQLIVEPGETTDFYMLFFPQKFSEEEDEYLQFGIHKQNDDIGFVYIDLDAIKEANSKDDGFKAGKRYWFKVTETEKGLTWTNYTHTVEVDNITDFNDALRSKVVTHIALKNPIIIDSEEQVYFVPDNHKNITMSDDFTWTVNGTEYEALIVNSCPRLELRNCTILGSDTLSSTDKYLLESTDGILFLDRISLQADGNMNAVNLVDNKEFYLYGNTSSIKVQNDEKYAFNVHSSTTSSTVYLDEGTIEGNVYYLDNYSTNESHGWFVLDRASLDGNVTVEGDNVRYLNIELREGATYTGNRIAEVSSFAELINLEKNGIISEIKLKNPIIIDGEDKISFYGSNLKKISMSSDFTWTVNGTEYDALIVNSCPELEMGYCTIFGTSDKISKYLIQTDAKTYFYPYGVKLDANGSMNGMKVADAKVFMSGESSIDVESADSYALYIAADDTVSSVNLSIEGEINGDIFYENNYDSEDYPWSMLQIDGNCTLNGEVITAGNNIQDLRIHLYGEYNGNKKIVADDIQDIQNVVYNETVDTIVLKNPIVVTEEVSCIFSTNKDRVMQILMDEQFTWKVGEVEYDALFVNNGEGLNLGNCNLKGSAAASTSEKYLLETTASSLFVYDSILDADGEMNGVRVKDSWFSLMDETSVIDVENGNRVAINFSSSADEVAVDVHIQGTVNGNVTYVGLNSSSNKSDSFAVSYGGKIYGDLNASYKYCRVTYEEGSVVEGNGWADFVTPSNN